MYLHSCRVFVGVLQRQVMPDTEPFDQSISEAATFFGVHLRTVQKWALAGLLPGMRTPGRRWRFRRSDLEAFAAKQMHQPAEEASA